MEDVWKTLPNGFEKYINQLNVPAEKKIYAGKHEETLKGRLPLKQGSVRPETLGKRVSD